MKTQNRYFSIGAIASIVAICATISFGQVPGGPFGGGPGGGMRGGPYGGGMMGGPPGGGMMGRPGGMMMGGPGGGMMGRPGGMMMGGPGGGMMGRPGGMMMGGPGMMPGMMPGAPGMMPGGRGGNDAERNLRTVTMLENMDTNKDGRLEQKEIPENRRPFVQMIAQRLGVDPNRTIDLKSLKRKYSSAASSTAKTGTVGAIALPENPIIPYFGEMTAAISTVSLTVLAFGQSEPKNQIVQPQQQQNDPRRRQQQQQAPTADMQLQIVTRTARDLLTRNDKNRNGTLDKINDEWNGLPFDANAADKNKDGRLTLSEIVVALGGKPSATMGAARATTLMASFEDADRLPPGVPTWFIERDKDKDGQLTLVEYANGEEFTDGMLSEFRANDQNGDGLITIEECYSFLKAHEEKKRKEEQAAEIAAVRANPQAANKDDEKRRRPSERRNDEKSDEKSEEKRDENAPTPTLAPATSEPGNRPERPTNRSGYDRNTQSGEQRPERRVREGGRRGGGGGGYRGGNSSGYSNRSQSSQ